LPVPQDLDFTVGKNYFNVKGSFRRCGRCFREFHCSQLAEKHNPFVTPAEAGVQKSQKILDSRLRGNDGKDEENCFFSDLPFPRYVLLSQVDTEHAETDKRSRHSMANQTH